MASPIAVPGMILLHVKVELEREFERDRNGHWATDRVDRSPWVAPTETGRAVA